MIERWTIRIVVAVVADAVSSWAGVGHANTQPYQPELLTRYDLQKRKKKREKREKRKKRKKVKIVKMRVRKTMEKNSHIGLNQKVKNGEKRKRKGYKWEKKEKNENETNG